MKILFFILLFLSFQSSALTKEAGLYTYSHFTHPKMMFSISDDRTSYWLYDIIYEATPCRYGDYDVCIEGEEGVQFTFTVPIRSQQQKTGIIAGTSLNVIGVRKGMLRKKMMSYLLIREKINNIVLTYFYSYKYGLQAVYIESDNNAALYLSNSEIGYGAIIEP